MTPDTASPPANTADFTDAAPQAAPDNDAPPLVADEVSPSPPTPRRFAIQKRVRAWIQTLHRDPSAEERAAMERRARLLVEINRTVAEAPDDIPIKDLVARLNRHHDD